MNENYITTVVNKVCTDGVGDGALAILLAFARAIRRIFFAFSIPSSSSSKSDGRFKACGGFKKRIRQTSDINIVW
ncbi:unnamed protein product [Acanthoscelides obtectus]|uniref:Uncharacterized protein n=1 Tax=Acanthoscelides obtectus TaxID=200917 RepID=A0A9P0K2M2_ACAOB|nr:unnamed protein product [Acanthoscelides obtectus]CAK1632555.1 hypothetical protein AOBTE_LOCUS7622 [Acanthoscelides obtectus]